MTVVEAFVANPYSSSPSPRTFAQKMLRRRRHERLFEPTLRGCSSVVEHLLAKEDVASSSLVTRSPVSAARRSLALPIAAPAKTSPGRATLGGAACHRDIPKLKASRSYFLESELAFLCIS